MGLIKNKKVQNIWFFTHEFYWFVARNSLKPKILQAYFIQIMKASLNSQMNGDVERLCKDILTQTHNSITELRNLLELYSLFHEIFLPVYIDLTTNDPLSVCALQCNVLVFFCFFFPYFTLVSDLSLFHVAIFSCCNISTLHSFCISIFSCSTFSVLYYFYVALSSFCILSCCTLSTLHFSLVALYRVPVFIFFVLHICHVHF